MPNLSPQVECTIPVLPVRDLDRTTAFYTKVLGFKVDWIGQEKLAASVSRDGRPIMFLKHDNWPGPAWVWIGADESLFESFRAAGAKVRQEPTNQTWAYEMKFEDPDGNILWLATGPKTDLPME
jgi:predicted lactoylglutathione lyase